MEAKRYIAYYDADCGLCSAFIRFAQNGISNQSISFVPNDDNSINIQLNDTVSKLKDNTVILYDSETHNYHIYAQAIFVIFSQMGSIWKFLGLLRYLKLLDFVFNPIYRLVAKRRAYISKLLGLNSCRINI